MALVYRPAGSPRVVLPLCRLTSGSDDTWYGALRTGYVLLSDSVGRPRLTFRAGYRYAFEDVLNSDDAMSSLHVDLLYTKSF